MQDASYWATQLKSGAVTFREYVEMVAKKVSEKNPKLNALVNFDPEEAIRQFDRSHVQETLFGGLPIPLKMLGQNKAGWQSTSGSKLFTDAVASETSNFVSAMEKIGFTPLGQTSAPEFGFKNVSDPELYGPVHNPLNLDYSPGGSSGGAAATVASGIFPMAAASDGGGSIRIPASFTGLVGLKPTRGTMPIGPGDWRGWQGASINFALTVSMRDTESLFYAMRTSQATAAYQAPSKEWHHRRQSQRKHLKIAFSTQSPVGEKVSATAIQAIEEAVSFLETQGHEVVEIPYPVADGQAMMASYSVMNGGETAAMFAGINAAREEPVTIHDIELVSWGMYQYGKKLSAITYIQALQLWDQLAAEMENFFTSYDLFLTPTTATTAPLVDEDLQSDSIRQRLKDIEALDEKLAAQLIADVCAKSFAISPFSTLANLTGQPAISLPTAKSDAGLPLGIQFMAAKGREDLLFQIGKLFEHAQRFQLSDYWQ